jgi:hypothetical protein
MSPDQYTEVIEFLGRKFDRIEQRLDFGTVQFDHKRRISVLEAGRRDR